MEPEDKEDRLDRAVSVKNAVSVSKAEIAAAKMLTYISKHTAQFKPPFKTREQLAELDDYYQRNWDKIVAISCKNNGVTPEELISAMIDLL